jgi:hypothetical protein
MTCDTGYKRVKANEIFLRHFIEQFISLTENSIFRVKCEQRVPRTCCLVGKIIKGFVNTIFTATFGIQINESIGEKNVKEKRGFDELRVYGFAMLQAFGGNTV